MRQILATILSVYIAFAACYPCSDNDLCTDDEAGRTNEVTTASHDHDANAVDLCSPFCICSCCSTSIQQPQYQAFVFYFPKSKVVYMEVKPQSITTISHAIWQPPRLS